MLLEIKDTLELELYTRIYLSCSSFDGLNEIQIYYKEANEYLNLLVKYDSSLTYMNKNNLWLAYMIII